MQSVAGEWQVAIREAKYVDKAGDASTRGRSLEKNRDPLIPARTVGSWNPMVD